MKRSFSTPSIDVPFELVKKEKKKKKKKQSIKKKVEFEDSFLNLQTPLNDFEDFQVVEDEGEEIVEEKVSKPKTKKKTEKGIF